MRALTLRHPWAWAILERGKRIENRIWRPPANAVPGWIGLHGGVDPKGKHRAEALEDLEGLIARGLAPRVALEAAIRPGIVGAFKLLRAVHEDDDDPLEDDPWFEGPWGWVLGPVIRFAEPIPCRGAQGLWEIPAEVHTRMRAAYRQSAVV